MVKIKLVINGSKIDKNHFVVDDVLDFLSNRRQYLLNKQRFQKSKKKGGKKK